MSGPERVWLLNITLIGVFFLLVRCINAAEIANDAQNTTPQSINDNYEMIDVEQREGNNNLQAQTGQTTRILTSGEVDDNFWLKHLGEDFKYAIHLQVGDDPYNGIYNMSEDGSNYDVKHDYHINDIPVDGNRAEGKLGLQNKHDYRAISEKRSINADEISFNNRNTNSTDVVIKQETNYKLTTTDKPPSKKQSDLKKHRENQLTKNAEYTKAKKVQNINVRFAQKQQKLQKYQQKQQAQEHQKQVDTNNTLKLETNDSNSQTSPIVVTLPNNDRTVLHSADDETPVVVKMPPVIYHQEPNYEEYPQEEHTNQTTQHEQTQQLMTTHNQYTPQKTQQQQQTIQYENTDFTQYNPVPSYPSDSLHVSHTPPMTQHSPPMTPLTPSQYYNPALLNAPTIYRSDTAYAASQPAAPNSIAVSNSKEQLQMPTDAVHYILRKPSTPYKGQASPN